MANHIKWYFNVTKWTPSRQDWLKLLSCEAPEEVDRINKYVYQEDAKSTLIGRALIRKFVSKAINVPSSEVEFIRTQHGRPKVRPTYKNSFGESWPKTFDFNVSHSGDYCILAGFWSQDSSPLMTIGVDVTQIVKKKSRKELAEFLTKMSRREFTRHEWDTVAKVPCDRQKCVNFTRLWCLKESYIKSIGLGLTFRLSRIEFHPSEAKRYCLSPDTLLGKMICDTQVHLDNKLASNWHIQETALDTEHLVAVAYQFEEPISEDARRWVAQDPFNEISIDALVDDIAPPSEVNEKDWTDYLERLKKDHY